jgi:predicted Ser/Thr protein kinase
MFTREDRLLSEILVSRGLVAQETLEPCARERDGSDPRRSLVDVLVESGGLDPGDGERALQEARGLDRSLTPEVPGGGRLGEFRLLREIGRGGMGIVYEAEQEPLGRRVALKVLPAGAALDERLAVRFLREARAAARLDHPGIVRVFTSGQEAGVLYFTMELVHGRPLDRLIAEGPFEPGRAARVALEVARALWHAHQAGLVHRDIKPENILTTEDGRARLTDFGLVHESSERPVTISHMVLGTPAFIAPEQARGDPVDPRSDVYSLGAVLYAMLAGRPPYTGRVPAVIISHVLGEEPPPLASLRPGLPEDLIAVCSRALARDPRDRYQTAGMLAEDLERYAQGRPPEPIQKAAERGVAAPAMKQAPRLGRARAIAGGGTLVLAALAGLAFLTIRVPQRPPEGSAPPPEPVIEGSFSLLPSPPGPRRAPSLSPDGRRIVHAGTATGRSEIYLQDVGGSEAVYLTEGFPVESIEPSLSPDGASIAFATVGPPAGLAVMDLARREHRLFSAPEAGPVPSWSPDGRELPLSARLSG